MMKALIVFILIAIFPVSAQEYKEQTGWHLDSIFILFDGSEVEGLDTVPLVRAFYQGVYKNPITGTMHALSNVGVTVELTGPAAKALLDSVTVNGTTTGPVLNTIAGYIDAKSIALTTPTTGLVLKKK